MTAHPEHSVSGTQSWLWVAAMVGIIFFQGWLAYTVIGDLGPPEWDYRPVPDVYGESAYAMYPPVPYAQHIRASQGAEMYPLSVLKIPGAK
jgi:hypothetical protein